MQSGSKAYVPIADGAINSVVIVEPEARSVTITQARIK